MARRRIERCPECKFTDEDGIIPVPDEIPHGARILFILEQPGKMENNIGRPLIGKSGDEANGLYFPLAGLARSGVGVANTVKCKHADSGEVPPDEVITSCSEFHLRRTIERMDPSIIVLCGGVSNSLIGKDIEMVHGTGRMAAVLGWTGWTFSTYHPALGMHMPSAMQSLIDDFKKLRDFIRHPQELMDEIPNPKYYRLRTPDEVDAAMEGEYDTPIGVDTESKKVWKGYKATIKYIPYCLQFCIHPGEAFLILISDREAWSRFGYHINKFREILMQNAPHDMAVLLESGVDIDWDLVTDIMVMSYIDARVPRGLKPMSAQVLHVTAKNFEDVVRPYGVRAAIQYFLDASELEWPVPEPVPTGEYKEKNCPKCKGKGTVGEGRGKKRVVYGCPECNGACKVTVEKVSQKQGVGSKIKRILGDYAKNPDSVDPWKRWEGWEEGVEPLIHRMGPLPLTSIHLVSEKEIKEYACLDAHSTRRMKAPLLQRHVEIRRRFSGVALTR